MVWIVVLLLVVLALWLYFRFFKIPKIKNLMFIDGGLGAGKTFYAVHLAVRLYKRQLRRYKIAKFVFKPFALMKRIPKNKLLKRIRSLYWNLQEPVLYSNIPLRGVKHTKLTAEFLTRDHITCPPKSVVLMDDISLIVDQMNFKDRVLNKKLSIFFKLWRHQSHGGYIIATSQSINDCHHALRYALSDYLYIHSSFRVPFFRVLRTQEMAYCADRDGGAITNVQNGDIENTLKMVLVRSKYRKFYDTYCYSILTDGYEIYKKDSYITFLESAKTLDLLTLDELTKQLLYGGDSNASSVQA